MKKFSKKGVLLFAGAMAVCAFAMPSMASAASWGVVGSHHTLDSSNIGFSAPANGLTSSCTNSSFTTTVTNSQLLTITTGTFNGCTSRLSAAGADCTTTSRGTGFPWRAIPTSATNIQIQGIHIDVTFENMPGRPTSCGALTGQSTTLSGTLSNGVWSGNGPGQHAVNWTDGTGLTSSTAGAVVVTGGFSDTQQTLIVTG